MATRPFENQNITNLRQRGINEADRLRGEVDESVDDIRSRNLQLQ